MSEFVFECGHPMSVGQAFENGRIVCPICKVGLAPYDRETVENVRVHLELHLAAPSRTMIDRWLDGLTETIVRERIVASADVTVEQAA